MNERTLVRLCLAGSVIGIVALYFSLSLIQVPRCRTGEITPAMSGSMANVSGKVSDVYVHRNGHIFFTLNDGSGEVKVVVWDSVARALGRKGINATEDIRNGALLEVTGEVILYRGETEIVPKRPDIKILE